MALEHKNYNPDLFYGATDEEANLSISEGTMLVGDSNGLGTELDIGNTSSGLAIGNGTTATIAAMSGNATMSTAGVVAVVGATTAFTATVGVQSAAVARTATSDGLTTAIIADGTAYVTVTSASANNIIVLPTPTPGNILWLNVGSNGYELRSDTPASVAINGGTGANVESAVGANVLVRVVCTSATTWVANKFTTIGTESALEAAA